MLRLQTRFLSEGLVHAGISPSGLGSPSTFHMAQLAVAPSAPLWRVVSNWAKSCCSHGTSCLILRATFWGSAAMDHGIRWCYCMTKLYKLIKIKPKIKNSVCMTQSCSNAMLPHLLKTFQISLLAPMSLADNRRWPGNQWWLRSR